MKNIVIPDGFGVFLQQKFGGALVAPVQPNPCGHSADSNVRLKEIPVAVSMSDLTAAVHEYYELLGCHVLSTEVHGCFRVSGDGFTLYVALSRFAESASIIVGVLLTVDQRE